MQHNVSACSQREAHMIIKSAMSETFDDYAYMFIEHIRRKFVGSVCRVDIVFDMYRPDSFKTTRRRERGNGTRRQVECRKKLPANWTEFLRDNDNTEIFHLLNERATAETFPGKVVITQGDEVLCSEATNVEWLSPCTHEEADTRMLLHAADGVKQGRHKMSSGDDVNRTRQVLFTQKGREIKKIPPTQAALMQHLLLVGYRLQTRVYTGSEHLKSRVFNWGGGGGEGRKKKKKKKREKKKGGGERGGGGGKGEKERGERREKKGALCDVTLITFFKREFTRISLKKSQSCSKMKGVYTRRGRSETDAIRSLTSVGKHSSKESVPSRPVSRLCRQTAAFKLIESARDNYFYTKEFQEKVRKLLLKKQPYKAPVFDPKLARAYALLKKEDAARHLQEKAVVASNTDSFQVLPEKTGIPYEFRIPEFYNRLSCSGDGTDIPAPAKATRSLLVVCPRVPPILRYLGTDQASLNMWCQTDGLSQFIELRQGELIPGLYARVDVPVGVELKFTYCVRLNDGQVVATDSAVQLAHKRYLEADREVYYVMPKLVPVASLEHMLGVEGPCVEEEKEDDTMEEKTRRAGLIRRLLEAIRRLLRRSGKN
ncbi:hypothetical protein LSAT2_031074 [Lamellibrachia satsuma]|nr:hypothetical protein LSAT2_031074 [Lamellibrachia satsuma]